MRICPSSFVALGVLALGLATGEAFSQSDANPEPAAPRSEFRIEYESRLAGIDADDAAAHYELGAWAYDSFDDNTGDLEPLELAVERLQAATELGDNGEAKRLLSVAEANLKAIKKKQNVSYLSILYSVLGGLGIFLLGMKNLSDGIQAIAGDRLRRMIGSVTDNRLLAVGVGTAVTCLVQSSSITTVIVVGFVNGGLMVLHQAIGVIMGANIGTTITGWVLVLKIGKYGLPILGAAAFVYLFSRNERRRYIAMAVLGLGMVFFGLELMKNGFSPMKDLPAFREAFEWFRADSYFGVLKCALVGCVLTFIVQSSSATLGITIGLAQTGAIPFETAAALVLGENIGTTITAWLASIGTTTVAKRAAYAHVFFNLLGVAWITAIFGWYVQLVGQGVELWKGTNPIGLSIGGHEDYATMVTAGIAATHTGFNVVNTLMFVPFVRVYARLLERLVPDKTTPEVSHLTPLDVRLVESPVIAIEQSRGEILRMAHLTKDMLDWTLQIIRSKKPDEALIQKVFRTEEHIDKVEHEIVCFLTDLMTGNVPISVTEECRQQFRMADEYESISDYCVVVLKSHLRMRSDGLSLSADEAEHMGRLHEKVEKYIELVDGCVRRPQRGDLGRRKEPGGRDHARVQGTPLSSPPPYRGIRRASGSGLQPLLQHDARRLSEDQRPRLQHRGGRPRARSSLSSRRVEAGRPPAKR